MKRLECLDAMRGVAAMLVVLQHVLERVSPDVLLLQYCNIGLLGVLTFFLLSGFVVPSSIRGERPLERFAISRMARLLPALWLSVAVMVLLRGADLPTIAANMAMLARPLGFTQLSGVYWTLTYELVFYFACAALFTLRVLRNPAVIGMLIVACLCLAYSQVAPMIFGAYLLMGLLLRIDLVERHPSARLWSIGCGVLMIPMVLVYGYLVRSGDIQLDGIPRATSMVLALPLFAGVLVWRPQPGRALVYLGAISYSVYLFQDAVIDLAQMVWPEFGAAFTVVVLLGVVALAALVYELVEKPFIALGRRLAERRPLAIEPA